MDGSGAQRIAIQGDPGSNSHIAASAMLGDAMELVPCRFSADVCAQLLEGQVTGAVLPIENSLHGSVAEHYDLLLKFPLQIVREYQLRIEHNLIALPGVQVRDIREILSHPVALSQCRKFLAQAQNALAQPFYDTAGSVHHIVENRMTTTAAIAPRLAAEIYGAQVIVAGIEDHHENFTRFHLLRRAGDRVAEEADANKLSVAFALEHRPGTLVEALKGLAAAGADLTKIESRPVPGRPWEYVFFADLRFAEGRAGAEASLAALTSTASMVKELGRYRAAKGGAPDFGEAVGLTPAV